MALLGIVDDEWPVRTIARMVIDGAEIAAVLPLNLDARRLWLRLARSASPAAPGGDPAESPGEAERLSQVTLLPVPEDPTDLTPPPCTGVLVVGAARPRARLAERLPEVPRFVALAAGPDRVQTSDPVHWCLRTGGDTLRVRLTRGDAALSALTPLDETEVTLTGLGYGAGVDAVAAGLTPMLRGATGHAGAGAAESAAEAAEAVPDRLPIGREQLRIDWAASAQDIVRLIRSSAGRSTAAWTYLQGVQVSPADADLAPGPDGLLPPGTLMARDGGRVVVQAGSGLVGVTGLRDSIGAIPPGLLRPGLRFGVDAADEVRTLHRRVADLERTLQWLLTDPDALPVVREAVGGGEDASCPR